MSFYKVGRQIVSMAKHSGGPGSRSVYRFRWFGLEFEVLVTVKGDRT